MSQMTDARMELAIGRMLRAGVTLAAVVVLAGGIVYLTQNYGPRPDYQAFRAVPAALRKPIQIAGGALHGDGRSIIQLGLLLLIATPVARVVLAAVSFLLERDRLYFVVSTLVLAVLVYSLLHTR